MDTNYRANVPVISVSLANPIYRGPEGPKGDKGDRGVDGTVKFDDLTEIQKASLRGPKGERGPEGPMGPKGEDGGIVFENLTPEQKEELRGPKGEDGYTPVKGVDYFDGQPGKDGKDGTNGKDGVDGYTPVKGVDYFDGADGAPGKDGVDGKDYVLTDADKREIAGMVEVTGGGEGGSVNIDNKTIIEENGVIKTAVGGYKSVEPEILYSWANNTGITGTGGYSYLSGLFQNGVKVWREENNGEREVRIRMKYATTPGGEIITQEYQPTQGSYQMNDYWWDFGPVGDQSSVRITINQYNLEPQIWLESSNIVYSVEFYTPDVEILVPIDNTYIDTNYIATREYVAELIGGIENGSY